MGTVIIHDEKAYVFRGLGPEAAVREFLQNWMNARSFQVFPFQGYWDHPARREE